MKRAKAIPIELRLEERQMLEKVVRAYTLSYKEILRTQIILMAADGQPNARIAAHLRVSVEMVRKWRKRFALHRLAGLNDKPRSGAPSSFSPSGET